MLALMYGRCICNFSTRISRSEGLSVPPECQAPQHHVYNGTEKGSAGSNRSVINTLMDRENSVCDEASLASELYHTNSVL